MKDYAFRDVQFMTGKEKGYVLRDWEKFVESGFSRERFTKRLYNHLIQHCSFIAHYDLQGFYDVYFSEKRNTGKFIDQFTTGISAEYGMDYWLKGEYGDVNTAMTDVMKKYSPELKSRLDSEIEREDIAKAGALLARHGKKFRIEDEP